MLQVRNLNKMIKRKCILKDVNFQIKRGQIAVFLGGSGVGKTTLLRVLNNLETYDEGSFILDNNLLDLKTIHKNSTVGMVFQHFNLFDHLSVEKNIMLALIQQKKKSKFEAHQIAHFFLERYGLIDKAQTSICQLSGGQKQRLAIARSVALNPQILCLDEPTSALDQFLTRQVATYLSDLAADHRIVMLTTHDMSLLKQLDHAILFLMHEGTIVESGLMENFKSTPSHYPLLHKFLEGFINFI